MTEEQFIQMYRDCGRGMIGSQNYEDWRLNMIKYGYILKSELQQKVEEAEGIINQIGLIINNCTSDERIVLVWKDAKTLYEIFQLLKQSHPEFKK